MVGVALPDKCLVVFPYREPRPVKQEGDKGFLVWLRLGRIPPRGDWLVSCKGSFMLGSLGCPQGARWGFGFSGGLAREPSGGSPALVPGVPLGSPMGACCVLRWFPGCLPDGAQLDPWVVPGELGRCLWWLLPLLLLNSNPAGPLASYIIRYFPGFSPLG